MAKTADTIIKDTDKYIKDTQTLMMQGAYAKAIQKSSEGKTFIEMQMRRKRTDIWEFEKTCQSHDIISPIVDRYYYLCLLRSFWKLEDFIIYMERYRPQSKRFYLPRMNPLSIITNDIEDLFNRKIKFLGISLPSRTGKSTLSLFALAWLTMKRPNSHSAIGCHSGILAEGFYDEMMNFYTSEEYCFKEIYEFWHGNLELLQDKSAEHLTINLAEPDRMNTITMRGIDGTWTGAIDISWSGVLVVDDLIRDRTHALSPTRMESTWNEYLNKMHDRLNPFLVTDDKDPREFDLQGLDIFPEPPEMMIGTLWNIYDPLYRYERKYSDDPLYKFRKIPALNEDNESNFSYVPTSYYLNQREILSEADFAAKFQQAPFVREGLLFAKGELNYFDGNLPNDKYKIIAVLDPAVGGGDYLSMPIIAVGKRKYVIDWIYDNRTRGYTIPRILNKLVRHQVRELYYENNGIGRAFEDPIKEGLKKEAYFGIKIKTFNAPEHMNKVEKITYYADSVKNELYFIEEGTKGQYKRSQDYIDALWNVNTFTAEGKNAHDDAPDSLSQVMRVFEEQSNGTVDIILNPFR